MREEPENMDYNWDMFIEKITITENVWSKDVFKDYVAEMQKQQFKIKTQRYTMDFGMLTKHVDFSLN